MVHPVAYGGGEPIFRDLPGPLRLELRGTTTFASGTMLNLYRPAGGAAGGTAGAA